MSESSEQAKPSDGAPLYGRDGTAVQPSPPEGSLVSPEGVNAGSADVLHDDGENLPSPEAAVAGDRPATARMESGAGGPSRAGSEDEEGRFVGAPAQEPGFPSTQAGSSGQDAGSIE